MVRSSTIVVKVPMDRSPDHLSSDRAISPTRLRAARGKRWALRRWTFPAGVPAKVFCVGFNKTGTTSIAELLQEFGLVTCHQTEWADLTDMASSMLCDHEAFTDGEQPRIDLFDQAFPGSKFILNTRELLPWLVSRVKWVRHRQTTGASGPMRTQFERLGLEECVLQWSAQRDAYHRLVLEHFAHRQKDLLVINVVGDVQAGPRLARFLGVNPLIRPKVPHRNPSTIGVVSELEASIGDTLRSAGLTDSDLRSETLTSHSWL